MTDKPADEKLTSTRMTFTRRKAAGIGMSLLAGGFAVAGGSALLGGAASAASPGPVATLSPAVAAQVAAAAAAPSPVTVAAPVASVPAPVASVPAPSVPAPAAVPAPVADSAAAESADDAALDAYFAAGYNYDDAVALAKAWGTADPFETKVMAGGKLEAGEKLPIAPGSAAPAPVSAEESVSAAESAQVDKFFSAGYTYDDAVQLAKIWGSADPYHAKITGGKKLLAGQTLPVKP